MSSCTESEITAQISSRLNHSSQIKFHPNQTSETTSSFLVHIHRCDFIYVYICFCYCHRKVHQHRKLEVLPDWRENGRHWNVQEDALNWVWPTSGNGGLLKHIHTDCGLVKQGTIKLTGTWPLQNLELVWQVSKTSTKTTSTKNKYHKQVPKTTVSVSSSTKSWGNLIVIETPI